MPERVRAVIKQVITQELKDPKSPMRAEIMAVARDAVPEFFQDMLDGKPAKSKVKHKSSPPPAGQNGVKVTKLRGHKNITIRSLPGSKRRWNRGNPTPADYAVDPWKYDDVVCEKCGPDKDKTHLTKCPIDYGAQITRTWRTDSVAARKEILK